MLPDVSYAWSATRRCVAPFREQISMTDSVSCLAASESTQRLAIQIRGQVQGVGFRPFVYRLAVEWQLSGWVRNDASGVAIEAQGATSDLQSFLTALRQPPPLARIDAANRHRASLR